MGKHHSKSNSASSFDQEKTLKLSIRIREKNVEQEQKTHVVADQKKISFLENSILIWLDSSLSSMEVKNIEMIENFHRLINIVEIFSDVGRCFDFISSICEEKIFLVVSGSFGEQICSLVKDLPQIHSIYIYCRNRTIHEQWTKSFPQVRGIHTQFKSLATALKTDLRLYDFSLTAISLLPLTTKIELNASNREFLYFQLLKSLVLESSNNEQMLKDFRNFVSASYTKNEKQIEILDNFLANYSFHSPVWWYTRPSLIYQILRKAFQFHHSEIIFHAAFFIRDIHREIKQIGHNRMNRYEIITVYRVAQMNSDQWQELERSRHGLLAFDDFLLTTVERSIALRIAEQMQSQHPNWMTVIYRIEIDPIESSIPFILLHHLTYLHREESEVFFSMNTIFRIDDLRPITNRRYEVFLSPASKKDEPIQHLIDFVEQITANQTGWYRLRGILVEMEDYRRLILLYEMIFKQTEKSLWKERAFLKHEIGYFFDLDNQPLKAIESYKESLEISAEYLSVTDRYLLPTYMNLADVFRRIHQLNEALDEYQNALKVKPILPLYLIQIHVQISTILYQKGKDAEADNHFQLAEKLILTKPDMNTSLLAATYHQMGNAYYQSANYAKALEFYEVAAKIDEKPSSATHFNLAHVYQRLKNNQQARLNARKAFDIARLTYGADHSETKENFRYFTELEKKT